MKKLISRLLQVPSVTEMYLIFFSAFTLINMYDRGLPLPLIFLTFLALCAIIAWVGNPKNSQDESPETDIDDET